LTHLDTNILIDIAEDDLHWANWSQDQLARAMARAPSSSAPSFTPSSPLRSKTSPRSNAFLEALVVEVEPIPREALFLAGRAFRRYRSQGGPRMASCRIS
jgi:predicted nucleic acid-binding protein